MKSIKLLAAASLAVASLSANAGLLGLTDFNSDGSGDLVDRTIPGVNNFFAGGTYNVGNDIVSNTAGKLNLTFTFLGKDAGYVNQFDAFGSTLLNSDSVGSSFSANDVVVTNGGLIDFSFTVTNAYGAELNGNPVTGSSVVNGANQSWNSEQSFAVMLDHTYNGVFYDAILLWDDSGKNQDDNHDDHIIGIQASIPEPTTLALLGLGLAGLGISRRNQAK